ncbi:SDR family NAD(P)-dependent oxidoreductase [Streptomyces sp. NPDC020965]|uniref:SDR family NAD(P)-dependent oxidoreductase n=1 Tax=Streptomyces sp. NPDC020965 TaxID=3365105 RepID=UPI00378D50A2
MTLPLEGKNALVTGGTRGIGRAAVLHLARAGADVGFTYLHSADQACHLRGEVEELGRRVWAVRADSGDPDALRSAVTGTADTLRGLDILVNNAGLAIVNPIEAMTLEDIDRLIAVNFRGPYLAIQAAVPHLRDGGRIITIGSILAERAYPPPYAAVSLYSATKAGLTGMTRALARELAPANITINLLTVGHIDTDLNPAAAEHSDFMRSHIALGRYGDPSDIAQTIVHLASSAGSYITGACLAIDGGLTA